MPGRARHGRDMHDRRLGRQRRERRRQVAPDQQRLPVRVPRPLQLPHEMSNGGGHTLKTTHFPAADLTSKIQIITPNVPGTRPGYPRDHRG